MGILTMFELQLKEKLVFVWVRIMKKIDIKTYPSVREALLYEKLSGEKVRCLVCGRQCVVAPGERSFCKTRTNIDGALYTLVYGDLNAVESRPIEIKPFFHYWPGSTALTFSTWSCNFRCPWCQNFTLSRGEPDPSIASYYPPEKIIELALEHGDRGLCISFTEPTTLFEYALDVFKLGKEVGLYCCFVSNGYMTPRALELLTKAGMDGLKIDLKGDTEVYRKYCSGLDVEKVWATARQAKKLEVHVEIVHLVVSGVNDKSASLKTLTDKHLEELGAKTPLHFTRYYPAYKFHNPPTSVDKLEGAYQMAKEAGVLYPYLGNVSGHKYENTYCPRCGTTLIKRLGYNVIEYRVTIDKKCFNCSESIPIVGGDYEQSDE